LPTGLVTSFFAIGWFSAC